MEIASRAAKAARKSSPSRGGPEETLGSSMNRRAHVQAASGSTFTRSAFAGAAFWAALFAVVLSLASHVLLFMLRIRPAPCSSAARRPSAREDYDAAFDNYQRAYAKAPKDLRYRTAVLSREGYGLVSASEQGPKAVRGWRRAGRVERISARRRDRPGNEAAQQEIARVRQKHGEATPQKTETSISEASGNQGEIDSMASPAMLRPVSNEAAHAAHVRGRQGHLPGRRQSRRGQCSLRSGLHVEARSGGSEQRFAARRPAHWCTMSNTFWRPVTSNTLFVAQNTRAKRTELTSRRFKPSTHQRLAAERPE